MVFLVALMVQAAAPQPPPEADMITVTATRIDDYAAAVQACVARRCPPRADIATAIRYAEVQFRTGDYRGARKTLAAAVGRNRQAGAVEPIALSQLYRAQANVAVHYGEPQVVARATYNSLRVLQDNLPNGAPETLAAELAVADIRVRQGDNAGGAYAMAQVARRARSFGATGLADTADLHRGWVLHVLGRTTEARTLLATLAAMPGESARVTRLVARILLARMAPAADSAAAIDALIASLAADRRGTAPVLVWGPPLPAPDNRLVDDRGVVSAPNVAGTIAVRLRWVDIGYAIRSDGRVEAAEILRGSSGSNWANAILAVVRARRYLPTPGDSPNAVDFRVERYTLTADFGTPTGSFIRRRNGSARYEQLDLTDPHGPMATP